MSLCVAALCSLTTAQHAGAQTNTAPARLTNRYLLIVETSRSMQDRAEGALRVAAELFTSGMGGQLQRGDTIGLWTFNDALHAGNFPLQAWSPAARTNMAKNVINFLRSQKFEKKPRFDKVLPALQQVVHNSDYITVIVISSGEAPVKGTPFDARVNEFYNTWRSQQKASRMPFLAILRGQKGQFADCAMHWAPWPIDLPALPQELLAARAAAKPAVAARPNPAGLPPISFTGHKPAESVPLPPQQNSTPNPAQSTAGLQSHNDVPTTGVTASGSSPTVLAFQGQPRSIALQAENASSVSGSASNGAPFKPQSLVAAATAAAKPVVENAQASAENPATNSSVSGASSIPPTVAKAAEIPTPSTPSVEKPANPPAPAPSVDILPSTSFVNAKLLWVAAGLSLALAALIFWRWREHTRPPLHVSLITRSLEEKQD